MLMALTGLGSNSGLNFGSIRLAGMLRLNSRTGTAGMPVSSLNCDRPLRSGIRLPETVMSTCGQITDSVRPYALHRSL